MNKLKEKIFAFILKHQPTRQVNMPIWKNSKSIAILSQQANIDDIIKLLSQQGKEVSVFTMPEAKDICWLTDRPKSQVRDALTAKQYDILIDLTQNTSLTMQYMAMYIKASYKTGRYVRDGIHDLTIDTAAQAKPHYLFEQIMRYIEMFGGK
jgi:pyridoxine 5'-phosphate synthase PdxJ